MAKSSHFDGSAPVAKSSRLYGLALVAVKPSRCFGTGAEPCGQLDLAIGAELSRKSIWPSEPNHLDSSTATGAKPSRQLDCMSTKLTSLGELLRLRDKNLVKRVYVQEIEESGTLPSTDQLL